MSSFSGTITARDKEGEDTTDQGGTPAEADEGAGKAKVPKTERPEDCGAVRVFRESRRRVIGHGVLGIWSLTSTEV